MNDEARAIMCVTNEMPDFRSCIHRGAHAVNCDGWQYRFNPKRNRDEATGRECKGCRPREARFGCVCLTCWESIQHALSEWPEFEQKIAGITRAVQRDNGGIRGQSLGYVPIPSTQLAVDEIRSYLKTLPGTAEMWVASLAGAKDAVRFARAVPAAIRTHAVEEKAHRVHRTRCTACGQKSLVWNPVQHEGADVTVKCSNPGCGAELDQSSFEKVAAIENPNMRGREESIILDAGQGMNATGPFAESFDPTRPEHEDLDPLSVHLKSELRVMAEALDIPRVNHLRKLELIDAIRTAQNPLEEIA